MVTREASASWRSRTFLVGFDFTRRVPVLLQQFVRQVEQCGLKSIIPACRKKDRS